MGRYDFQVVGVKYRRKEVLTGSEMAIEGGKSRPLNCRSSECFPQGGKRPNHVYYRMQGLCERRRCRVVRQSLGFQQMVVVRLRQRDIAIVVIYHEWATDI
ncbi:hypothetical protein RRF57_010798 [Xylaria bambusicola]|uniref:Uncharacterized protein n=1 Tax=Xylaria bambusicola TaxID=326684 RepID=A0AAN7Z8Z4_9PEZI